MKTPQMIVAVVVLFLCPVTATLVLAQQFTNPTVVVGEQPPPPPRPPPPPPNTPTNPGRGQPNYGLAGPRVILSEATPLSVWNSEEQMNGYYVNKFIQSAGFGGVRMTVPTMTIDSSVNLLLGQEIKMDGAKITTVQAYNINQLELIGIAKHETPVAFVVNRHSEFLINRPNQTTPSRWNVPLTISGTRALTDFEKAALVDIQAGKEVVGQPQADGSLLVVGAVRAQEACIQCHDGYKAGDALGALSYRLSKTTVFNEFVPTMSIHTDTEKVSRAP